MSRTTLTGCTLALAAALAAPAHAQTFKMGTMAPEGSTWHQALVKIAEQWRTVSKGKVKLKIFAGGVQGDEGDVVKKMRVGQLQAGALTAVGMKDVAPEPQTVCTPLMVSNYDELDYVMEKVGPELEAAVATKGFQVLAWTDTGTMYFFSRNPAATPKELFPQKVFAVAGDPGAESAWRSAGFTPVVLSSVNLIPSLQTGMVDAFASTPLVALSLGWYSAAPNMTVAPWGMLIGALVVSHKAWSRVPDDLKPQLLAIARKEADALKPEARRQEREAMKAMQSKGLNIVSPSAAQLAQWEALAGKVFPAVRGKVMPEATFDRVKAVRDEYRAKHK